MAEKETFATLGKREAIRKLFEGSAYAPFCDPAAFQSTSRAHINTASKIFLEGIDFDLVYFPLKHLGYKCVTAVTAELYACMSVPRTLSINLGVSAKLDFEHIQILWGGMMLAARKYGYKKVALDIVPSKNGLCIGVTATGETTELSAKRRSLAHSKDLICLSGSVGGAYLGQALLESEKKRFENGAQKSEVLEKYQVMVGDYLKPELPVGVVENLEDAEIYPSYGYSVRTGLADAVLRLCGDSNLGAKIYVDKIPFEGNSFALGQELDVDPMSAAMNGGDDYKLLYVVPITQMEKFRRDFQTFSIIGHLAQPEAGSVLVMPEGVEIPLKAQGW